MFGCFKDARSSSVTAHATEAFGMPRKPRLSPKRGRPEPRRVPPPTSEISAYAQTLGSLSGRHGMQSSSYRPYEPHPEVSHHGFRHLEHLRLWPLGAIRQAPE
jgi:hypothetical protein